MRLRLLLALGALFLLLLPHTARAAEALPGDACSDLNYMRTTGGPETGGARYFLRCNGTVWVQEMTFSSANNYTGILTTTPAAPLHVNGEAIIGPNTTGIACTSAVTGGLRWDSADSTFQMCDGTSWRLLAAVSSGGCTGVNAFSFTNVTNAPLSTVATSNVITPSGCSNTLSVSVTGNGTPQISVAGGPWTNSTVISPGQTLQVRLTSSASASTTFSAVVAIGTTTGTIWTVTTKASNTRIFSTSSTYNGNLGGLSGADTYCRTAAASLGYGSYWRAVISDSVSNAKDRLLITYPVVLASNSASTIASTNLWSGSISNVIGASTNQVWTGSLSDGTYYALACSDWASTSGNGSAGRENASDSGWLFATAGYNVLGCSGSQKLYCLEQPDPGCSPTGVTTFTDLTGQAVSSTVSSNTITPTGCATTSQVIATGPTGTNPQVSINGGAWVSSGTMNAGDTLKVRLTTGGGYSQTYKARVYIGDTTTIWSVTTIAGGNRLFVDSAKSPALGGLAGADSICTADANAAGYSGSWKAILSDSFENANSRMTITYPVVRATDGALLASANLWGVLSNSPAVSGGGNTWTGSTSSGTVYSNATCNDWTSASSSYSGYWGSSNATGSWLNNSNYYNCTTSSPIYCLEQASPGCSPTGSYTFTDVTGAALSTQVTSNTITPTGCASSSTVKIIAGAGATGPQVSINGGAWASSGTMNAGDTLQVRFTTGANYGSTYKARIYIGGIATVWSVTTLAPGSYIFPTPGGYSGSLGGLTGADAFCNSAATSLGYSGYYKAVLSDSLTSATVRLSSITYPVVRPSDGAVVAGSSLWGSLSNPIYNVTGYPGAWTGHDSSGNSTLFNCNDWTSASASVNGSEGAPNSTTTSWLRYSDYACSNSYQLYCLQQPNPGCGPTGSYTFTDVTGAAISTQVTSNTVTPSGCASTSAVSVYTNGSSAQVSINGGAWASSGTMNAGDTLQVRFTTGAGYLTTYKARIYIGTVSTTWSVTTGAPPTYGYLVLTASTWNGNLGGVSGANSKCYTELTSTHTDWMGYASASASGQLTTAKIGAPFVCSPGGATCNTNFAPNSVYKFAKAGEPATGGALFVTDSSGQGPGDSNAWSGSTYFNGSYMYWGNRDTISNQLWNNSTSYSQYNVCNYWANGTNSYNGFYGLSGSTNSNRWLDGSGLPTCDTALPLVCVVNP